MRATSILRSAAVLTAAMLGGSCNSDDPAGGGPSGGVTPGAKKLTVVVAVVDSLMPDEITEATPNLKALKDGGTFYAESRSVFSAETIPNHVAMMTGVYPRRSGIVANSFLDRTVEPPVERNLSDPADMNAVTLFTWIHDKCVDSGVAPELRTGATLSKKYLYQIFAGGGGNDAPDTHWDPETSDAYIPSPSEHTPDTPTMNQALTQLPGSDFFFLNLGDVDRSAHAGGQALRAAALTEADAQIGRLVDQLESAGRWDDTVLILVSDHGMDYSPPTGFINVQPLLNTLAAAAPAGCGYPQMTAVDVGGTDSIFVRDETVPAEQQRAALRAVRACLVDGAAACTGKCATAAPPAGAGNILYAWYTQDDPDDAAGNMDPRVPSLHPNFGGLTLSAKVGFRFSEPSSSSNPIPGNHGHPATLRNTLVVAGGSPWVKAQVVAASAAADPLDRLAEQSENVDVAATVAWLLGLNLQAADFRDGEGFDGRVLKEAFTQFDADAGAPAPTVCGRFD